MEKFTRLEDNQTLQISENTVLLSAPGIYNTSKTREFSYGNFGKAINLSSSIDQKVFTLLFTSGDFTGTDQKTIDRFFNKSNGLYRLEADETLGIEQIDFYVNGTEMEIFEGNNSVIITCTAHYGDFVEELTSTIFTRTIEPGGNSLVISVPYTNNTGVPVSIRLTIEGDTVSTWTPDTPIALRRGANDTDPTVSTRTGQSDENGTPVSFNSLRYSIDSWDEIIEGYGFINPGATSYWKIQPGQSTTIYVNAFAKPIVESKELHTKLEAVVLRQKETL